MVRGSESKRTKHPGYIEHDVCNHEHVMNVMVIGAGNEDPSTTRKGTEEPDEKEEARYTRSRGLVEVVLEGDQCEPRTYTAVRKGELPGA